MNIIIIIITIWWLVCKPNQFSCIPSHPSSFAVSEPRQIHCYFFHFSMYVNLVIGRPLTPQVPIPTLPLVLSGVANMLFLTRPLLVLENTYKHHSWSVLHHTHPTSNDITLTNYNI